MPLTIASRLGPYEILGLLGAGGMGEVYCARDARLNRDVALKVLPEVFALDPDRLARFKREAQVLASLSHPNIAIIHGLEEADGVRALVLELVEGPTLADRIADGPIPVEDALPIARQIAEALEAAHELGVIHRDLKPANIKITARGAPPPRNGAASALWLLPLEGDRKPIPYLQTPFNEANARFSPGPAGAPRWMAYQSNESGQNQIYVQTVPASGAKYQISNSGGTEPAWRRDGKELFYFSTDRKLMAVPIKLGTSVEPGTPQELFANAGITGYTPSADGQRFLVNVPAGGEGATAPPITVVLNWTAGLKK